MISSTSSFASSMPATSANVTLFCESLSMRALALPKRHRLAAARLELPHEEEEHDADEEHRQERDERGRPEGRRVLFLEVDLELPVLGEGVVLEVLDERLVGHGAEGLDLRVLAVDDVRERDTRDP